MGASKKKVVRQRCQPSESKRIGQDENPDQYYSYTPAWNFNSCDKECWSLFDDRTKSVFWDEILPKLQSFETQKWHDILVDAKKQNHSIETTGLNKNAIDRLNTLMIEYNSIISLRLKGQYRLYGYMTRSIFNLLWVDLNHGDNETCVCRSKKKHT